jgi:aspartate racemase
MHIGLIGGIGPAATDHYYRSLIARHAELGPPLDLTIAHADARELVANLAADAPDKQADVFVPLIRRLQAAGARAAAVTSMAGHFCVRELEARSPLPIINVLPALDAALAARGLRTVGLIGTRTVMESRIYGRIAAAAIVIPEGDQRDQVHRAYVEMAIAGRVTEAQRQVFFGAGRDLCRMHGAEAVILGGTDLFLAFDGRPCGFDAIDCVEVHVEAIHRAASGA